MTVVERSRAGILEFDACQVHVLGASLVSLPIPTRPILLIRQLSGLGQTAIPLFLVGYV